MTDARAATAEPRAAPAAIDAARLPHVGWGPAAAVWWAVWSLITIEGTVFVFPGAPGTSAETTS